MRNIKALLEYEGTGFNGFCIQPGPRTVQGEFEEALKKITGETIRVTPASRTDSGVHAWGQVVNFKTECAIETIELKQALNANLSSDIDVLEVSEVPLAFNARKDAKSKEYIYYIYNSRDIRVALRRYVWAIGHTLDLKEMSEAAKCLLGEKDFSSFANADDARSSNNFVRTLYSAEVEEKDFVLPFLSPCEKETLLGLRFKGNGFLYKMVRSIVGTLVDVGVGKISVSRFKKIIEAKNRVMASVTAPAQGLHLLRVEY